MKPYFESQLFTVKTKSEWKIIFEKKLDEMKERHSCKEIYMGNSGFYTLPQNTQKE